MQALKNSKASIRNSILKDQSISQNLARGALSLVHAGLVGQGWDASFLGLQVGPEHPHQVPDERDLRGMHWQCSSTEQVPHNTSLVSQALLQVWGATAAGGSWVQLGQQ